MPPPASIFVLCVKQNCFQAIIFEKVGGVVSASLSEKNIKSLSEGDKQSLLWYLSSFIHSQVFVYCLALLAKRSSAAFLDIVERKIVSIC